MKNNWTRPEERTETNSAEMDSADARARKDLIAEMVNKSHHAGKIYRLPPVGKMKDPMTKMQLKAWTASFLALFDETQQVNVKHTMFLWRSDDDFIDDAVRNGIPGSAEDVKWLFCNSRLLKQDFTPELTTDEMQIIEAAETIDFPQNHTGAATLCSTCGKNHHGSCASIIAVYNKVVEKITGGQMKTAFKLFEGGPSHPTKKNENLIYMRKMIETFKSHMANYINLDLLAPFEDGQYHTWKILIQAIYRVYNIDDTQENMAQLFHSIKEAASTDKSTETKIANLREILRRVQIKGKENYFISRDHEQGREVQTVDEQYTPQVNLLLSYIIVEEKVEKEKWNELQLAFERKIESGWSYQKWHQKRPELYKLIDRMQKPKPSRGGALCSIESRTENIPKGEENEEPVEEILEKLQLEINQIRKGQWQNSNRYKSGNSSGYRKEANGQQSSNWKTPSRFKAQKGSSKSQICIHCTHHSGTAVYHTRQPEVYGGPECAYDQTGAKKGNSSFNNRVAMLEGANDAENDRDGDDLRNYYKERLLALSNIPNDE